MKIEQMTIDDAIKILEDGVWWDFFEIPYDDPCHDEFFKAFNMALSALRAQQEAKKDGPRYAERLRVFDDPWTGRRMTTCSWCQGKVGPKDRFCKHCGREFQECPVN